jgi:hypothetical protein
MFDTQFDTEVLIKLIKDPKFSTIESIRQDGNKIIVQYQAKFLPEINYWEFQREAVIRLEDYLKESRDLKIDQILKS